MVIAAALCQACRGPTQQAEAEARDRAKVAAADIAPKPYSIQPGDTIEVKFAFNPDFDNQLPVRPDGRFALPLVGDIEAVGSTPDELRARLETAYAAHLRYPEVTVNVVEFGSNVVYVGGEVRDPSILKLDVRTTALRAIMAAGGGLTTGDLRKVVIVRDRGTPEPEILMLDLSKGLETLASAEDLWLQPRDMVFVPRTGISKANQFVREYIRDMLPIQSSFNLQYQFTEVATGGF
jgi:polysaccharide export outer membrane protein